MRNENNNKFSQVIKHMKKKKSKQNENSIYEVELN